MSQAIPTIHCRGTWTYCKQPHCLAQRVLEKHFTHDKTLPQGDHYHAMDKNDLKHFYTRLRHTLDTIGELEVRALPEEEPARRNARRSLVAARDICKGAINHRRGSCFQKAGARHFTSQL